MNTYTDKAYPGFVFERGDSMRDDEGELYWEFTGKHADGREVEGWAYLVYRNHDWEMDTFFEDLKIAK